MTTQEENRCLMIVEGLLESVRDLVKVQVLSSVFRCRVCGGATACEVCPACERKREQKLLSGQIQEARK